MDQNTMDITRMQGRGMSEVSRKWSDSPCLAKLQRRVVCRHSMGPLGYLEPQEDGPSRKTPLPKEAFLRPGYKSGKSWLWDGGKAQPYIVTIPCHHLSRGRTLMKGTFCFCLFGWLRCPNSWNSPPGIGTMCIPELWGTTLEPGWHLQGFYCMHGSNLYRQGFASSFRTPPKMIKPWHSSIFGWAA